MKNLIKTVLVAATLVLVANTALAQTKPANQCEMIESLARQVMSNRQSGVSLSSMMKVAETPKAGAMGAVMRELTLLAYKEPQYSAAENKRKSANEFANQAALLCLKKNK
jgi:hypothetical protein